MPIWQHALSEPAQMFTIQQYRRLPYLQWPLLPERRPVHLHRSDAARAQDPAAARPSTSSAPSPRRSPARRHTGPQGSSASANALYSVHFAKTSLVMLCQSMLRVGILQPLDLS
jgi:hypothetical protein